MGTAAAQFFFEKLKLLDLSFKTGPSFKLVIFTTPKNRTLSTTHKFVGFVGFVGFIKD